MTLRTLFGSLVLAVALVTPALARERILIVGDSWGTYLAAYKSFDSVLASYGIANVETVSVAVGGTTAAQWATAPWLAKIDDALAAHPTIDLVHVSLGMNDVAAYPFRLLQKSPEERDAVLDGAVANIGAIARHVLDRHPGVEIVLAGYDYPNLVEFAPWSGTANPWQDQGASNWVLGELERKKDDLGAAEPRIHRVNTLGLMQMMYGDAKRGIPAQSAPWPGGYPFLPGPKASLSDGVHLSKGGSWWFAWFHVLTFYSGYFADHP